MFRHYAIVSSADSRDAMEALEPRSIDKLYQWACWLPKGRDLVRQIIGSSNTLMDVMVRTAEALSNEISSIFNRSEVYGGGRSIAVPMNSGQPGHLLLE